MKIFSKRKKQSLLLRESLLDILYSDGGKQWVESDNFDELLGIHTIENCYNFINNNQLEKIAPPGNLLEYQSYKIISCYNCAELKNMSDFYHCIYEFIEYGFPNEYLAQPEVAVVKTLLQIYIMHTRRNSKCTRI